jgi:peptide/nickel transport system substrate-binding protein
MTPFPSRLPILLLAAAMLAGCAGPPAPIADRGHTGAAGRQSDALTVGGQEPPSEPGRYGGSLTTAQISDPKTFNPWVAAETSTTAITGPMFEALNRRNAYTLEFEPRLADLPEISDDGLTYTYRIREGVAWSDGRPVTADDILFTLQLIFDETIQSSARDLMLVDVPQPDGSLNREPFKYRKVDERTIEFTLPVRYAPAETIFSVFAVAPKHRLEAPYRAGQFNSTWGVSTPPDQIVTSGAWTLAEYVPRQRVVLKRNPRFWGRSDDGKPLPYLDQWVFLIVPDVNTTTLKFRSGETDLLEVPANDYAAMKEGEPSGDYTVVDRGPTWGFNYIGFNLNPDARLDKDLLALFQDVRFRRAVSHAMNRQRMADDVFQGLAEPLYTPLTPANHAFYNPNVPKFEYDLDKARRLLAETGLQDSDGNGFLEWRGKEVKFNVYTNGENNQRKDMATIMTEDLRRVGLNAQFTPIQFNDLIRRLDAAPYEWQAVVLGFTGGPEPHTGASIWRSSGRLHQWHPRQKSPATQWEAEIDRIWIEGAQELAPARRKQLYDRWQEIVAEQQPLIFTVVPRATTAVRSRFANLKMSSLSALWNVEDVFDRTATRETP